jgi:diguanylate cyclase (GGDEF)-like protein
MVDLRTLLALLAAAEVALAAALWLGVTRRAHGIPQWSSALALRALAICIVLTTSQPQAGAVALACGLVALSATLQSAAIMAFAARQMPTWVHTAAIAAVAVPMQMLANDPASAILFAGVVLGTLFAVPAAVAWQVVGIPVFQARQVLAATFSVTAIALAMRGIASAWLVDPVRTLLEPTGFAAGTELAACSALIAASMAFLLLHKARADAEAQRLATTDPLTGAYNRRTFQEVAEREMSRARRANQPLSIIVLDIDHLRKLNDDYGQRAGDEVLQHFADIVRSALRKEDMLVRFAGEQFLVMLPEVSGPGAVVVAGRIRRAVADSPIEAAGHLLPVTVSLGVAARLDEGPESIDGLVARAESALQLAKQRGRNRVVALSLGRSIAA